MKDNKLVSRPSQCLHLRASSIDAFERQIGWITIKIRNAEVFGKHANVLRSWANIQHTQLIAYGHVGGASGQTISAQVVCDSRGLVARGEHQRNGSGYACSFTRGHPHHPAVWRPSRACHNVGYCAGTLKSPGRQRSIGCHAPASKSAPSSGPMRLIRLLYDLPTS